MEYKIEKVPMPVTKSNFPFDKLKKGESFFEPDVKKVGNLRTCAHNYAKGKNDKVKFSIKKDGAGFRCYRVK